MQVTVVAAAALRGKLRGNIQIREARSFPGDAEKVRYVQPTPRLPGDTALLSPQDRNGG